VTSLEHRREGAFEIWESPAGNRLRMWMGGPHVILSEARGHFEIALARAFIGYLEPLVRTGQRYTGLHDWSGVDGYDNETRKLFTRWTDLHRKSFHRIVIYTESRIVRMGIATARMVLGSIVEAVATRAELEALVATARGT
jgi:hypothetical protein